MAEGILRKLLLERGLEWVVDSAGISPEHEGEDMHPNTRKILELHQAVFDHAARAVVASDADFDLILAATAYQVQQLKIRFPKTKVQTMLEHADVPDPWYGTFADYQAVYAMLEPRLLRLVANV